MQQINTFSNHATRQIQETVRRVQGMPITGKKGAQSFQRSYKARLTATIDDPNPPNDPLEYQFEAEQVYFDGSAWQTVTNGLTWDANKILYVYDSGEVGDIVTAEPIGDNAKSTLWMALKPAGGGAGAIWAKITSGSGKNYIGDIYDDPIETNPALETGVTVYAHNVDFGSIAIGSILPTSLVGTTYYIYPATFGG